MKYVELDFTPQLERTIRQKEKSLEKLLRAAMEKYSPLFEQRGWNWTVDWSGGYESSL